MKSHTYGSALALIGVSVPDHLIEDAEVPVLSGPQAQGDLLIYPAAAPKGLVFDSVPTGGVQVVHGEATGNTHWLHRGFDSPGVEWARVDRGLLIGYVRVPEGQTAQVIHSDEHGANGVAAGVYAVNGKQELADELRRVQD